MYATVIVVKGFAVDVRPLGNLADGDVINSPLRHQGRQRHVNGFFGARCAPVLLFFHSFFLSAEDLGALIFPYSVIL